MKIRKLIGTIAVGDVLLGLSAGVAMARGPSNEGGTILDRLVRIDGSQALVAAALAGEEAGCLAEADPSPKYLHDWGRLPPPPTSLDREYLPVF